MPHPIIQATPNVTINNPNKLLKDLNNVLWESGQFGKPEDIKARIINFDKFLVGIDSLNEGLIDKGAQAHTKGFIYVQLKIMSGRSLAVKEGLVEKLSKILRKSVASQSSSQTNIEQNKVQLCIEVTELSQIYKKYNI